MSVKSLRIFNSKLFYFGHCWEKLIEWLADNKLSYLNWYWRESSLLVVLNIHSIKNLIQADLEGNDLIVQAGTLGNSGCRWDARNLEPLAYTRASFSWILLPILGKTPQIRATFSWILLPYTRVNSPNHSKES